MKLRAGTMPGLVLALAVPAAARPSAGARVEMHVTEIAGDIAFVDVGEAEVVPGLPVELASPSAGRAPAGTAAPHPHVVEVNAKTAAVELDGAVVAVGDTLAATPDPAPHVPILADNTGQWPDPVLPATQDTPAIVPLVGSSADRKFSLALFAHAFGAVGQGYRQGEGDLRVIGSFQLMSDRPLGADLDASARVYAKGYTSERAPLLVHAALLRYGDARSPDLAIGRLHYAATSLGMLDGGRAAAHVGHLELAAFGGLVPDPIDGRPSTDASRFGAEVIYRDPASEMRPRLAVSAHASTWQGELDERRLDVAASMVHGGTWLDAWTEVQSFANDNPFGASPVEIVGAGASVEWRRRDAHLGADVSYLVPERSLRIAALIPEWLCTRVPDSGPPETCTGEDRVVASTASAGLRGDTWAIDGAGSIEYTREAAASVGGSGYVRGELRRGIATLHATASPEAARASRAGFGEVGAGIAPSAKLDASIAYRPELLDEQPRILMFAGTDVVHSILADARATVMPSVDLGVSLLTSFGRIATCSRAC